MVKSNPEKMEHSVSIQDSAYDLFGDMLLEKETKEICEEIESGKANYRERKCRKCGGEIDRTTKKCTSCGKQHFRLKKALPIIILSIIAAALGALNIWQYSYSQSLEETISEQSKTIATQKSTISSKDTKISNLCFPSVSSPEMEASKKELYDALVASDLKKIAEDLNLPATKKKAKEKNYDYDAYQAELATGWLGSVNASHFYLNKDDSYLSKKRFLEKGKIINTTIPYKGTGKNIQYPVDALQAFKAHDWNKLKELRKKYNFTGDN